MYCGNCGHQMKDGERFCTECGSDNKPKEKKEEIKEDKKEEEKEEVVEIKPVNTPTNKIDNSPTPTVGIFAIIFSIVFWPVGLVLGIIAIVKGKEIKSNRTLGIVATILSSIGFLISILILSIFLTVIPSAIREVKDEWNEYEYDNDYSKDNKELIKGKWTCTISSGKESVVMNFKDDNEFDASHENDRISGTYYAYTDYQNTNTYNIYMYYYDDDNYTSTKANFMMQTNYKAIMTIDDQTFNCLK